MRTTEDVDNEDPFQELLAVSSWTGAAPQDECWYGYNSTRGNCVQTRENAKLRKKSGLFFIFDCGNKRSLKRSGKFEDERKEIFDHGRGKQV
jgi:hypothetical protein